MPYTQIIYQIVFGTKYRSKVLTKDNRSKLFAYMVGIVENKKCHPYQINGIEDHVHIATSLHPTVRLSDLVKDIKMASSIFIKENDLFPLFNRWQVGYSAFTYNYRQKNMIVNYIKKQEKHHKTKEYIIELKKMLEDNGVKWDEKYLN